MKATRHTFDQLPSLLVILFTCLVSVEHSTLHCHSFTGSLVLLVISVSQWQAQCKFSIFKQLTSESFSHRWPTISFPSRLPRPSLYLPVTPPPSASWVTLPTLAHFAFWKEQLLMTDAWSFPCFFPPVSIMFASAVWLSCWTWNRLLLLFVVASVSSRKYYGIHRSFYFTSFFSKKHFGQSPLSWWLEWQAPYLVMNFDKYTNFFHFHQTCSSGSLTNLTSIAKPNMILSFSLVTCVSLLSLVLSNGIIVY